jgi:hypothetical protein
VSDAIAKIVCRRCNAALDAADNYCRRCGEPSANLAGLPGGGRAGWAPSVQPPRWSESPWVVLSLLFLVLGPLALPLLWRSRRFTPRWKVVLTVVVTGLTVLLLWQVWFTFQQAMVSLGELEKALTR